MMVLFAPDSYKGTLTSEEAARAMAEGFREAWPEAECLLLPLGDGGEGTADALMAVIGGRRQCIDAADPLGRTVRAGFVMLNDGTAILEMAAASGLTLLTDEEKDPLRATTAGTGQLLMAARERTRELILGIGGSATVDGGLGMARILGARFLDARGGEITMPGDLHRLVCIDAGAVERDWQGVRLRVMCDVDNPLTGCLGAARVFGPQKGATPRDVELLDRGLNRVGSVLEDMTGERIVDVPGAGAAGGLGAMLRGLLGAELLPGAGLAMNIAGFDDHTEEGIDLVVTGEGRMDAQTLNGKLPLAVSRRARRAGVPVVALPGSLDSDAESSLMDEFDAIVPVVSVNGPGIPTGDPFELLRRLCMRVAYCLRTGSVL